MEAIIPVIAKVTIKNSRLSEVAFIKTLLKS
jgi:hypothetical protein